MDNMTTEARAIPAWLDNADSTLSMLIDSDADTGGIVISDGSAGQSAYLTAHSALRQVRNEQVDELPHRVTTSVKRRELKDAGSKFFVSDFDLSLTWLRQLMARSGLISVVVTAIIIGTVVNQQFTNPVLPLAIIMVVMAPVLILGLAWSVDAVRLRRFNKEMDRRSEVVQALVGSVDNPCSTNVVHWVDGGLPLRGGAIGSKLIIVCYEPSKSRVLILIPTDTGCEVRAYPITKITERPRRAGR